MNLCRGLLNKDCEKRIGYKNDYHEVLNHPWLKGIEKKKAMARQGDIIKKMKVKQAKGEIDIQRGKVVTTID